MSMQQIDGLPVDPGLLPALAALLRERSVSRAAERLGRTQPAVSHALARLRDQLGDPLLVRVGQRLTLTPRAEALREPLQRLLGQLAELVRPPAPFDPATSTRTFTTMATDYIAALVLPALLPGLRRDAPGIALHLRPPSRSVYADLGEGAADLGFVVRLAAQPGIRGRRLFMDRFVCVLRDGHPAARRGLDLAAFLDLPHALVAPLGTPGGFVDDALAQHGHRARKVALIVSHFSLAPAALADTDLVLTLPERLAAQLAAQHPLKIVPLPLRLAAFDVSLAWHDRVHHDPATAWMRAQILATARDP